MRVFAISDIHIDYGENRRWLHDLSVSDYREDLLILAGDVSHVTPLLVEAFEALSRRFLAVCYVPGNHDLWVQGNNSADSLVRFDHIRQLVVDHGIRMEPADFDSISVVPLFGWYDYSFGRPSADLRKAWMDYSACRWPAGFDEAAITEHFLAMNEPVLATENQTLISFSHFLPRIDLMPALLPPERQGLYPVLGSARLETQIRRLGSDIHIYGHSHINMKNYKDQTVYINNAFGYPYETRTTAKKLISVFEN